MESARLSCVLLLAILSVPSSGYMIHSEQLGPKTTLTTTTCQPIDLLVIMCSNQKYLKILCDSDPSIVQTIDYTTGEKLSDTELSFKASSMASGAVPCELYMTAPNNHVIYNASDVGETVKAGILNSRGFFDGDFKTAQLNEPTSIEMVDGLAYIIQESSLDLRVMSSEGIETHKLNYQSLSMASWDRALYITQLGPGQRLILNKFEDGRQIRVGIPRTSESQPSDGRFYSGATAFPDTMSLYLHSEMLGPDILVYTDDSNSAFKLINFRQQSVSSVCFDAKDDSTCQCQEAVISGLMAHEGQLIYGIYAGGSNFSIVTRQYVPESVSVEPKNGWRDSNDTSGQWYISQDQDTSLCTGNEIKSFPYIVEIECLLECTRTSDCYAIKMDKVNLNCVLLDRDMCAGNDPPGGDWSCNVPTPAKLNGLKYTDFGEMEMGLDLTTIPGLDFSINPTDDLLFTEDMATESGVTGA